MGKRRYFTVIVIAWLFLNAFRIFGAIDAFAQSSPAEPGASAAKPIAIARGEVESHRTGKAVIRADLDPRYAEAAALMGISMVVVVNPKGTVVSAREVPPRATLSEDDKKVGAAAGQLRYTPFELNGHPVWATFLEPRVTVLPLEPKPPKHVKFPHVRDWNGVVIALSRQSHYSVEIHGDGTVLYDGYLFAVAVPGKHRCTAPRKSVRELVRQFRDADFFSLRAEYYPMFQGDVYWPPRAEAYLSTELSIEIDGKRKSVLDEFGGGEGMPRAVTDLEAAVDRGAEGRRWVVGQNDLVDCLRREGWDFHSRQSAMMLASVAEYGTTEAVQDLLSAGVPMYAGQIDTPLVLAARAGNLETMRVLRAAGAGKSNTSELAVALANAVYYYKTNAAIELLGWMEGGNHDELDESPFMLAARSGVKHRVRVLLPEQADINARDKTGRTSLMLAVQQYGYEAETPEMDRLT